MPDVYLILGGNLGDRINNLQKATEYISRDIGEIVGRSSIYETEPWGFSHDSSFINQILRVNTTLKPIQVLEKIIDIEKSCGRSSKSKEYTAREMDIDILFPCCSTPNNPENENQYKNPKSHKKSRKKSYKK